jgi:hypothetical protein
VLTNHQKGLLHIYAAAAGLSDPDYRRIIARHAGERSAASAEFTQSGFDGAMAALETVLFDRVDQGLADCPVENGNRWIRSRDYWRRKLPHASRINSRQAFEIRRLWELLTDHLPEAKANPSYFAGLVAKATGRPAKRPDALSAAEAGQVIEALKSRLAHAITQPV